MSLFDLSDRTPTQSDRLSLGEGYNAALGDSRAFGYDPERRLALLPMTCYVTGNAKGGNPGNEAIGIRVSEAGTLSLVGRLALGPQTQIDRVLHEATQVYAVSRAGVTAAGADDLSRTGSLDFPGRPTR
ncbi:MAG: beta-propeller domain-containing protein [Mycobacteriales bacterium]